MPPIKRENVANIEKKLKWLIPILVVSILIIIFLVYTSYYYHADVTAQAALVSGETVHVTQTSYGWLFDGPSEQNALIFYPGAKVEETAYAPLLHLLAQEGMDVCLVSMPFRLAIFGANTANSVMAQYNYEHWYIGGHSLGGAMAANYAASHGDQLTGLILLAAYPTKPLNEALLEISIYGSEDGVLNMEKIEAGKAHAPGDYREYIIAGGNHAQFGNYGEQRGDGPAAISSEEQQKMAVRYIIQNIQ